MRSPNILHEQVTPEGHHQVKLLQYKILQVTRVSWTPVYDDYSLVSLNKNPSLSSPFLSYSNSPTEDGGGVNNGYRNEGMDRKGGERDKNEVL